jgi:hypothetical protein
MIHTIVSLRSYFEGSGRGYRYDPCIPENRFKHRSRFPTLHLVDFIKYATENFDCYWLTTHCHGDAEAVIRHLSGTVPEEVLSYLKKLKATAWGLWKTEAIDFSQDFV